LRYLQAKEIRLYRTGLRNTPTPEERRRIVVADNPEAAITVRTKEYPETGHSDWYAWGCGTITIKADDDEILAEILRLNDPPRPISNEEARYMREGCSLCKGVTDWTQFLDGNHPEVEFHFCPSCGRRISPLTMPSNGDSVYKGGDCLNYQPPYKVDGRCQYPGYANACEVVKLRKQVASLTTQRDEAVAAVKEKDAALAQMRGEFDELHRGMERKAELAKEALSNFLPSEIPHIREGELRKFLDYGILSHLRRILDCDKARAAYVALGGVIPETTDDKDNEDDDEPDIHLKGADK
jgi:hypothetical protein